MSRQDALVLSANDQEVASDLLRKINRIVNRDYTPGGKVNVSVALFDASDADSPQKVKNHVVSQLQQDWTVSFVPDSRDGDYYTFS